MLRFAVVSIGEASSWLPHPGFRAKKSQQVICAAARMRTPCPGLAAGRRVRMIEIGGIELLPDWPAFLSFVVAGLALNIVPGADMTFVIASSARGGRRDGIIAALGIGAGALVHVVAATLGL